MYRSNVDCSWEKKWTEI